MEETPLPPETRARGACGVASLGLFLMFRNTPYARHTPRLIPGVW